MEHPAGIRGVTIDTMLHVAVRNNKIENICDLVSNGSDINAENTDGDTPLHLAVELENADMTRLLIDIGANVGARHIDYMYTPLFLAIKLENVNIARMLLEAGADPNEKDVEGNSLLHLALKYGNEEISQLLLNTAGIDVNVRDNNGDAPVHLAAKLGSVIVLNFLVEAKAEVNVNDYEGNSPLHLAVKHNNENVLILLMNTGGDINAKNSHDETLLHLAVATKNEKILKRLINAGVELNELDSSGFAPLHRAVQKGDEYFVKLIIDANANVNVRNPDEVTPLHLAIDLQQSHVLKRLLSAGADANVVNVQGDSALDKAVATKNVSLAKILLERGASIKTMRRATSVALLVSIIKSRDLNILKFFVNSGLDVNESGDDGLAPLHVAVIESPEDSDTKDSDTQVVKLLLDSNAKVDVRDRNGDTPLHHAVKLNNSEVVELLINAKADVNAKSSHDRYPLHLAAKERNEPIARLLLEAGANIEAQDWVDGTPVHWAAEAASYDVLKLLFEAGANTSKLKRNGNTVFAEFVENLRKFNIRSDLRNVEKCTRLLIDYTDIGITNENRADVLVKVLRGNFIALQLKSFSEIFLQHVVKLLSLGIQIDQRLLDFIFETDNYNEYYSKCLEELEKAKKTKIRNCWVTFFNLIVDKECKLIKYAGNGDIMRDFIVRCDEFPIYGYVMRNNVKKGIIARVSFDKAASILSFYLPIFSPTHLIITNTLDTLSKEDWKKLCD